MNSSHDLTAYLLGELSATARAELDRALAESPALRAELESVRATHDALAALLAQETGPEPRETAAPLAFPAPSVSRRLLRFVGSPAGASALAACVVLAVGVAIVNGTETAAVRRADNPATTASAETQPLRSAVMSVADTGKDMNVRIADEPPREHAAPVRVEMHVANTGDRSRVASAATMPAAPMRSDAPPGSALARQATAKRQAAVDGRARSGGIAMGHKTVAPLMPPAADAEPTAPFASARRPAFAGTNRYDADATEQDYLQAAAAPLSTFSADVNTASYAYARRSLETGAPLAPAAVRIEEWLNNFAYAYPEPEAPHPVSVYAEGSDCPWHTEHKLIRIGLRAKAAPESARPPCNLIFLIDTSGSMGPQDRLPLAQESLLKALARLGERDRVGIVTYAGTSGIAAEPTVCDAAGKKKLEAVILGLRAGGSTNGAAGLREAYALAAKYPEPEGVNRVILATDGDFNVGLSGTAELVDLAKREAGKKVFLTVLGFGDGNLNADLMKQLSVKADGNHYYIDSLREGERVLAQKLTGTLVTVARDVKIQVDFNPAKVAAYRLIGYDTRRLANEDFNDDTKDAGEVGAGHTVTALYEIVPTGARPPVDDSRYVAKTQAAPAPVARSDEWLTVKVRYRPPAGGNSTLIETPLKADGVVPLTRATPDQRFAAAVAEAALVLRDSRFKGSATLEDALTLATSTGASDGHADRREFADLLRLARHR